MTFRLEFPDDSCAPQAARIWIDGWHEAHSKIIPDALASLRTPESSRERLHQNMADTRVAVKDGEVLGLCILKEDELYQMYVSPAARGTGLAQSLIGDAESRLREAGYERARLACAMGNERAQRFYEKSGWRNAGAETVDLDTSEGPFPLKIWRYEKPLHPANGGE